MRDQGSVEGTDILRGAGLTIAGTIVGGVLLLVSEFLIAGMLGTST